MQQDDLQRIATRLSDARRRHYKRASKATSEIGVSNSAWSNYENGLRLIPIDLLFRFCERTGEDPVWIIYGVHLPDNDPMEIIREAVERYGTPDAVSFSIAVVRHLREQIDDLRHQLDECSSTVDVLAGKLTECRIQLRNRDEDPDRT